MKSKMNIFDLCWCCFYLHDEKHDLGDPTFGASVSLAVIIQLYIVDFMVFPKAIGLYELLDLSFLPFGIAFGFLTLLFILRNRNKKIRKIRLFKYQKYRDLNALKTKLRFWFFVIMPFLLMIINFIIANTRYYSNKY